MNYYSTNEWKRLRKAQLQANPLCAFCRQLGRRVPATIVDHVKPHKGDRVLFFDPANLQSLCKTCHDSAKQRFEKSGVLKGSTVAGYPIDPSHHWNQP